jgi:hypothetical protein
MLLKSAFYDTNCHDLTRRNFTLFDYFSHFDTETCLNLMSKI